MTHSSKTPHLPELVKDDESGINMVDLMMWLVIAALMLATAIQGINYYQKAAYINQMQSDLSGAGANVMAVSANEGGRLTQAVAEVGVANTKWSSEVTPSVEFSSATNLPYLRVIHPGVSDRDAIYLFKDCAPFKVGVNLVPKAGSTLLTACGVAASPAAATGTPTAPPTTAAPSVTATPTAAPTTATPTPTPDPVVTTPAPVATTPAPVVTTPAPVATTPPPTVPVGYVDPQPTVTSLTYRCATTSTGALPFETNLTGKETWDDGTAAITYNNAAKSNQKTLVAGKTYKVSFDGTYKVITHVASQIRECLISVDHWGSQTGVTDATYGFYYTLNMVSLPDHIPTTITNMSNMLTYATKFNSPVNTWDVSNVTNMSGLFNQAAAFNQPVDTWNTSRVTSMSAMFAASNSFNQPLSSWNTGNVTNMNSMFYQNTKFNQNIKGWNVSKVTDAGNFRLGAVLTAANSPY